MTNQIVEAGRRARAFLEQGAMYAIILLVAYQVLPVAENWYFPIVDNAKIVDISPQEDQSVWFRYKFEKHRSCDLISYAWKYMDAGVIGDADIRRAGQTPSREIGVNTSIWWKLSKDEKLPGDYFVIIKYDCRFPWASQAVLGPFHIEIAKP